MAKIDLPTIRWQKGQVVLLEQTRLPGRCEFVKITTVAQMWRAIKRLAVRGAPAIGCAAAYGCVLSVWRRREKKTAALLAKMNQAADYLATSRPTAVNLFWALDRLRQTAAAAVDLPPAAFKKCLLQAAEAILAEDQKMCRAIGQHTLKLLPRRQKALNILTHCNAGGLATSGYGTALAGIYAAKEAGRALRVYADETRPLLQGARLTAWELTRAKIPVKVICDNMAAHLMQQGKIDLVIVGADRIAANGDAANKIGTLGVAILAKYFNLPFYVAAPSSTFDLTSKSGAAIPIEERAAAEVTCGFGRATAPAAAQVCNPAFDVTPAKLITAIITERGSVLKPTGKKIKQHLG